MIVTTDPVLQLPRPSQTARRSASGFTLLEVLIVIAIIGIISAIAYPSYTQYVQKTRRSDAKLALMSAVQAMERCRSTSYTYTGCTLTSGGFNSSPEGNYALTLANHTATGFTIKAIPVATSPQKKDTSCQLITINHQGAKGPVVSGKTPCWD